MTGEEPDRECDRIRAGDDAETWHTKVRWGPNVRGTGRAAIPLIPDFQFLHIGDVHMKSQVRTGLKGPAKKRESRSPVLAGQHAPDVSREIRSRP